jgi:hypothetical protein
MTQEGVSVPIIGLKVPVMRQMGNKRLHTRQT